MFRPGNNRKPSSYNIDHFLSWKHQINKIHSRVSITVVVTSEN